jgi:hypothetical protein
MLRAQEVTMNKRFPSAAVLALALTIGGVSPVWAQNVPLTQDRQQPRPEEPDNVRPPQEKAFTGVIVKQRDQLVLEDPNSKTTYKVDDQEKVRDYAGKPVKIVGTLDSSTNVIHVESIEQRS